MEADFITYYPHDVYGVAVYSEEAQPLRDKGDYIIYIFLQYRSQILDRLGLSIYQSCHYIAGR